MLETKTRGRPLTSPETLMRAAIKLFARSGFSGTSVKEIADEAKVNISLISYHFDGKEGLYRSCIDRFGKERLAVAQRLLTPASTESELKLKLQMFIEEFLGCHIEQPELTKIIQRECEMEFPVIQDIFQKTFLKVFETLVTYLSSAQKKGLIRADVDPIIFAVSFFGSITHFSRVETLSEKYFNRSLKSKPYRDKICQQLLSNALDGLLK